MAQRQEIEFVIRPDGAVEEHVSGVAGAECEAVTELIEKALGQIVKREHTGERFQQPEQAGNSVSART